MLKQEKIEFVNKLKEEMGKYNTLAVLPTSSLPDKLFQKIRNSIKPNTKVVVARKSLLLRAVEGNKMASQLSSYIDKNVVLLLSNEDPVELFRHVSSYKLKLAAKPNQIAPVDISIEAGETTIPPGQAVTDLKAAGIDVQIQKGKVVIAKSKVLVAKGAKISTAVSKALKMLEVMPFEASAKPAAIAWNGMLFTSDVLGITQESLISDIFGSFAKANALSFEIGYVTKYNVERFISNAYRSALALGVGAKVYEPGIVEKLLAEAMLQALVLNNVVKKE